MTLWIFLFLAPLWAKPLNRETFGMLILAPTLLTTPLLVSYLQRKFTTV